MPKRIDRSDYALPFGLIHDDASVGNPLRHRDGHAVLANLDGMCLGQREWDLLTTAVYYERLGWHARSEYDDFVYPYAFNILNLPGCSVMTRVHELGQVYWIGHNAPTRAEFTKRTRTLRDDALRTTWSPS